MVKYRILDNNNTCINIARTDFIYNNHNNFNKKKSLVIDNITIINFILFDVDITYWHTKFINKLYTYPYKKTIKDIF